MIIDTLKNAEKYESLHPRFRKAFLFLKETDLENLAPGKHEIDGDELYYDHQVYETRNADEKYPEAHKKYIDIQYIFKGREEMGFTTHTGIPVKTPYSQEKDIIFFERIEETSLIAESGTFIIFFPEEIHNPCCHYRGDGPGEVNKILLKVKA